jgi:DNA repair exonuclease SbcCD nuclease subunit
MKILLLSDLHLVVDNPIARLDDLVSTQWDKLDWIYEYARKNKINLILQAGDITHTKRSWSLLKILTDFLSLYDAIPTCVVKGQHDSYFHDLDNDKTTTGILLSAGLLKLLDKNGRSLQNEKHIMVYGASYGEEVPNNLEDDAYNILVIHAPIAEKGIPGVNYIDATEFLKKHKGYDLILCGDIHEKFLIKYKGRFICNTGPMLRMEASKYMFKHKPCFFVLDTDKNEIKEVLIPVAPAGNVLSRDHIDKQKQRQEEFDDFIDRVKDASGVSSVDFLENLQLIMKKNKTPLPVKKIVEKYMEGERSDV